MASDQLDYNQDQGLPELSENVVVHWVTPAGGRKSETSALEQS